MSDTKTPHAPVEEADTGHDYDGIRELDNRLPNWWLGTLFATIVFSVGYWVHYEIFDGAPTLHDEYLAELDEASERALAAAKARGGLDDTALVNLARESATLQQGQQAYAQFCASCHGDQGQGLVGPNLTDAYWLHGARPTEILKTVASGVTAKGMPAWEPVLGPSKVEAVTAYLLTMKGTNVPGREPQGEKVEEPGANSAPAPANDAPAEEPPIGAAPGERADTSDPSAEETAARTATQ